MYNHHMKPNLLMQMAVGGLFFDPRHLAHIRSAGSNGLAIFEELVAVGEVLVCVELDEVVEGMPSPMHTPVQLSKEAHGHTVVVSHRMVCRWGLEGGVLLPHCDHLRYMWNEPHRTVMANTFLSGVRAKHVELVGFESVRTIHFMLNCASVVSIDIPSMRYVASVWYGFLVGCTSLTTIYMSPMSNLTSIGDSFL